MCINDSMVSQIANAISSHWMAWADHWRVNKVKFVVGMNYSTAKNSNKKDWHIVRLTEEKLTETNCHVQSSCVDNTLSKPKAYRSSLLTKDGYQLKIEAQQGLDLWRTIAQRDDAYFLLCWALAEVISEKDNSFDSNSFITGEINEILNFSDQIISNSASLQQKQWFTFFARHFVDRLI